MIRTALQKAPLLTTNPAGCPCGSPPLPRMPRLSLLLSSLLLACCLTGCDWGTLSEEELRAWYQVEWEETPGSLLHEFADEMVDEMDSEELTYKKIDMYNGWTSTELVVPKTGQIFGYRYDGFWLDESGIVAARDQEPERGFSISEIPIDDFSRMIEEGRAQMAFEPASLLRVSIEPEREAPWATRITFGYTTAGESGQATFDSSGQLLPR